MGIVFPEDGPDRPKTPGQHEGFTIVLDSQPQGDGEGYRETALPFAGNVPRPEKEAVPERLLEMRRLFDYTRVSPEVRARNFYRQAVFMKDYEDDCPWTGDFIHFFPTYQDMDVRQLRGYFTWRTRLRRGDYQPIATSAAYIYVYELLNGVGGASPEECLEKLREFERGYLDSGVGDAHMRQNLRRWMLEYAVLCDLPPSLACQALDADMAEEDAALAALRSPAARPDEEIFSALCRFGGKKLADSPVLSGDRERGVHLFAEAWRAALFYRRNERDLFTLCFGERQTRRWYPLYNAIYYSRKRPEDRDYVLDDCRLFHCRNGNWTAEAYEKPPCDKARLKGFLRETDARLRRYLKTGRYIKEDPADAWCAPYIEAVIAADKKAAIEAARPKISLDLSGLEKIRRDALATQESLLVDEEALLPEEAAAAERVSAEELSTETVSTKTVSTEAVSTETSAAEDSATETDGIPLDRVQVQILRALLDKRDAGKIVRENHLMPTIAADAINEALFEEFGDSVVLCEGEKLSLAADYIEELEQYLGGTTHGGT